VASLVGTLTIETLAIETLAKTRAGAEEQGADGGFGAAGDGGELGGGEFVERGEQKDLALGFGQAIEFVKDGLHALALVQDLVGWDGACDEGGGEGVVDLVGADAAAAVECEVPGDADEPDAGVANGVLAGCGVGLVLVLEDAEEGVLDHVFGLGAAAQDGVGDAEEQAGVGGDEGGDVERGGSGSVKV
jgi:hypothetical protein